MRRCSFCLNNSWVNPGVIFFTVTDHIKEHLSYAKEDTCFICQDHFEPEDIVQHGNTKRLRDGALPSLFPRRASVMLDHNYVSTVPLDLDDNEDFLKEYYEECNKLDSSMQAEEIPTPTGSQNTIGSGSSYHPDTPCGSQNLDSLSGSQNIGSPSASHSKSSQTFMDDSEGDRETEGANIEGYNLIVAWSSLIILLSICRHPSCGESVLPSNIHVTRNGAGAKIKTTCNAGHEDVWESCESIGVGKWKMPSINLKIILYGFMTGMQFDKLKAFMGGCNILSISASTYYRYLTKIVYPVVWTYWLMQQIENIKTVMETVGSCVLCGDARFDSPGFSAKYCTYFIQETTTKKILALDVGTKGQVGYSGQMEVRACERLLDFLIAAGLKIRVFASDRSVSIRKLMATAKFSMIKHTHDVWHFIKAINKRLFQFFKLKSCPNLSKWQKSVSNMIWWALSTSIGNAPLAKQKVLSIFHHVSNEHTFDSLPLFSKCEHGELQEERDWIEAGSIEMEKLREAILGKNGRNLDDLDGMDEFVHTSDLESLNSLILKYASKTYSYSWLGMLIRSALAAIDFNSNVNRNSKKSADGKTLFRLKIDRTGKVRVAEQKEEKDYSFQENIFELCKQSVENGVVPKVQYPIDPEEERKRKLNVDKEELVEKYVSRMKYAKTTPQD